MEEWAVDRILSHSGQGEDALFEVNLLRSDGYYEPKTIAKRQDTNA